ncbi:methionine--tRNA ligase [Luteolibacter ambystomatis]|uniref:Methionine--tRNA ligase n=1 Tax=Luteolibacter ambystomatis TaxID=2824561 RepID=A0A975G9U8_9BACT|nr:methionine--tRNA ligase [Luteolibacter ambystomatis]QUE51547.1 methionine--tRNA ligase [Luteolibacter ambystomatis]
MFFLTTAIDYTNGSPHIGHAYEKVLADVIARYRRLRGDEVFFLTGVDQHGQKVQQTAEKEGVHPATYVKRTTKKFLNLWDKLDVRYDGWAETVDERHKACVRKILSTLKEQGQLYQKTHKGFYSVRQEQYLTDRDRNEQGEFGPEWGEVTEIEEENWYFKLSDHIGWLKEYLEKTDNFVLPAFRKAELLNALERSGETDLCISRPKERLRWGIEFPFDLGYVTYVWFDALINYVSFVGYEAAPDAGLPDFARIWSGNPPATHIIGKDILIPAHGIYWPCMLHAMGFRDDQMPQLLVHGWWNRKSKSGQSEKMSKSLGNVVDPDELADKFGVDALRYYLVRDIITGRDSDFDLERLVMLFNDELADKLGNLCNRALNMSQRFTDGILSPGGPATEDDLALQKSLTETTAAYREAMDEYEVAKALEALTRHVVLCNQYADRMKPWELKKDPEQAARVQTILYHFAENVAHCAVLLSPVVPQAAAKIASQLAREDLLTLKLDDLKWGLLADGHTIGKPKPVFPKIVIEEEAAEG